MVTLQGVEPLLDHLSEFEALWGQDAERLERTDRYRREATEARDPYTEWAVGEQSDYGRRDRTRHEARFRHNITLPLGRALTVKHAFRIAGRLPDVVVDRRNESPVERHRSDVMERIVWAILRESGGETLFADGAWDGSEVGTTVFGLYFDIARQMPIVHAVDPGKTVVVRGARDAHDFKRVYTCETAPLQSLAIDYPNVEGLASITPYENVNGVEMVRVVQMCDTKRLVKFAHGANHSVILTDWQHDYGFTPYVVIPNIGPYRDIWGWADYEFVRALVRYLPVMFSREADVLRAVANGAYTEKATGQNATQVASVLNEGGILPVKPNGEVAPIPAPEMPAFAAEHSQKAFDLFKMLGFAPDASWGAAGATSGSDRGLMLQPLMEYTAMKQVNWQKGLTRLFNYAFRMIEMKQATSAKYSGTIPSKNAKPSQTFSMTIGPNVQPTTMLNPDAMSEEDIIELPYKPKDIFNGDYNARFVWANRIDPDDPAFVMSELNKFQSGVQSLETTLERLGFQAPQDEMRRIEKEAERFPWVNQGLVSMLVAQSKSGAQGEGGGPPVDPSADAMSALQTMTGPGGGGALAADAGAAALGPDSFGTPYGAA